MDILNREPFSYRDDPEVPDFPDEGPVLFVDGDCALCSLWARVVTRADRENIFRLCTVQSETGRTVLVHFGLEPDNPESWIYLEDGVASTGMEGIARACRRLGGWLRPVAALIMLPPRWIRDWLYLRMARNRYGVLGRADLCALPDPKLQEKLIR
ncbi:MAG: DCC1-like thiol-disulfide oxidoreductase family protein [Pseudomonadota bacterium]